ncbi:hypothetical protein AOQ84DRAFT_223354 [Glonium stellatum]|uniref:Zn(2)-C6 fungal-type domain-containing protein n=1 Tax=Glonium stellatum TaxID=574774 RepID=A0A8E2EZ10_9PEZI|nr:hypothetical protein AOQ84DRAFT_223354 [Glonium stellatum]
MENDERGRKKAWKPKTKTGCITCRIRRVKCDEAKPHCERCTSTGRKCDGYKLAADNSQAVISTRLPSLLLEPGFSSETAGERQSLHFFHLHTAPELAGFFDSTFWLRDVLQASHSHQAIRYAVTAVGAMHQKFICGELPVVPDDTSDAQLRFALQQCNRSIQHIIKVSGPLSEEDRITAMTASILFTCLASLQGHQASALEHLRGGLKLLQEYDTAPQASSFVPAAHPVPIESLRAMFVSVDAMSRGIMSDEMLMKWEPRPRSDRTASLQSFNSVKEARIFIDGTFNELLSLLQALDTPTPSMSRMEVIMAECKHLIQQFKSRDVALQEFLARSTAKLDQQGQKTMAALKLYRHMVGIFTVIFELQMEIGELSWDQVEPELLAVLELSSQLLESSEMHASATLISPGDYYQPLSGSRSCHSSPRPPLRRPVFSFGFGVVASLYLVASRSRNPAIRRRAINLLLNYPRREGVWDSVVAGQIAWECMTMEESACINETGLSSDGIPNTARKAADIPEHLRVREVAITYTGLRAAKVEFRTTVQCQNEEVGIIKNIEW